MFSKSNARTAPIIAHRVISLQAGSTALLAPLGTTSTPKTVSADLTALHRWLTTGPLATARHAPRAPSLTRRQSPARPARSTAAAAISTRHQARSHVPHAQARTFSTQLTSSARPPATTDLFSTGTQ